MLAAISTFDRGDISQVVEPGMPCFLDGFDTDSDDLGDWWLDLGAVDLTRVPGM